MAGLAQAVVYCGRDTLKGPKSHMWLESRSLLTTGLRKYKSSVFPLLEVESPSTAPPSPRQCQQQLLPPFNGHGGLRAPGPAPPLGLSLRRRHGQQHRCPRRAASRAVCPAGPAPRTRGRGPGRASSSPVRLEQGVLAVSKWLHLVRLPQHQAPNFPPGSCAGSCLPHAPDLRAAPAAGKPSSMFLTLYSSPSL
uniref:Uncharacterized protein n=1 Tax=Pipistrellus kuhlii TaxID=59472 RepID=A0A7J7X014_PIPKU|nr:hypothetical protein mPipKuh1_010750 [Pipistrellus kuhlii]